MRSPSNDLHKLISSLSKDEKRYFKNYIKYQQKDHSIYAQLFDAISKQETYDEVKIKQKFRRENFVKQLSVTKNYLYHLLLNLLTNYHAQKSIEDTILQGLRQVKVLADKQLYTLAKKELLKIKKQATLHEYYNYNNTIIYWELYIENSSDLYSDWNQEQLDALFLDLEQTTQLGQDFMKIYQLTSSFNFILKKNGAFRSSKDSFYQIIKHPLVQYCETHPSLKVKIKGLAIKGIFHGLNSQYDQALELYITILDTYNNHPEKLKAERSLYLKHLNNAIFVVAYIKDRNLFETFIHKYKPTSPLSIAEAYQINLGIHRSIVMYNFRKGNFRENIAYIPIVEDFMTKNEFPAIEKEYFTGLFALQYFGIGNYEQSLIYLNEIEAAQHSYYYCHKSFSLILKMLIFYSKDELELMEQSLRKLYYFLRKKEQLLDFEKFILKVLRKVITLPSKRELLLYFKTVNETLIELRNNATQNELEPYTFFNYRAWLESQITGKKFESTAKEYSDFFP